MKIDVKLGEKTRPRIAPPICITVTFGDDPKRVRRYCRLRRLGARVLDRGERIRNKAGLSVGVAYPDGRFETDRADNFRYCRQILADLRNPKYNLDQRAELISAARWLRLNETVYRKGFKPFP